MIRFTKIPYADNKEDYTEVEVSITNSEADIEEVVRAFEGFIHAAGFAAYRLEIVEPDAGN